MLYSIWTGFLRILIGHAPLQDETSETRFPPRHMLRGSVLWPREMAEERAKARRIAQRFADRVRNNKKGGH